jgi:glycosyltransferase involved in cell wall biosynthesis
MSNKLWNGRSRRILIKPEGVILNKFFPKDMALSRSILGWSEDAFIFIFFDDGEYVKNKKLALETFEHFKNVHPNCELKLINGFKHDELINVYNAANVLLLTSYHEGSNNSIKEALACNLPIVSVNCGDAEERLKNVTNSFVCAYDYKELSLAVAAIHKSGERSNGKDHMDEFLVENVAESINKFYAEILK